jgi:hypothetical protein
MGACTHLGAGRCGDPHQVEVYIDPLKEKEIVTQQDMEKIFSNWDTLLRFNSVLLVEMQAAMQSGSVLYTAGGIGRRPGRGLAFLTHMIPWGAYGLLLWVCAGVDAEYLVLIVWAIRVEEVKLGALFKRFAPFFRMFSLYVASFDKAIEHKEELGKRVRPAGRGSVRPRWSLRGSCSVHA